jgi:hypothetical protein
MFLKMMYGWPNSLLDWDILFLLPLPWWGPVLAPMLIAVLMMAWGTMVTQMPASLGRPFDWRPWLLNSFGILLGLHVFMADALKVSGQGVDAVRNVLPTTFAWPLFLVALLLMSAPILALARRISWRPSGPVQAHTRQAKELLISGAAF